MGSDAGKPGSQRQLAADAFKANYILEIQRQADQDAKTKGKPLDRDEIQAIADKLILPTVPTTEGHWFKPDETVMAGPRLFEQIQAKEKAATITRPTTVPLWTKAMVNPHGANWASDVETLKQWSTGKDDFGNDRPALKKQAADIVATFIPAATRAKIAASYRTKYKRDPTEAEVIQTWANWKRDTTPVPKPAAEPPHPSGGLIPYGAMYQSPTALGVPGGF